MRVIIDCDPGNVFPGRMSTRSRHRSGVAARDRIDLCAITTSPGNTTNRVGYAVAQTMLAEFGVDVPLYSGDAIARWSRIPNRWRTHLDAARKIDGGGVVARYAATEAVSGVPSRPAAQAIGELVTAHPGGSPSSHRTANERPPRPAGATPGLARP